MACDGDERAARSTAPIVAATGPSADDAVVAIVPRIVACGAEPAAEAACTGTLIAPRVVVTAAHCLGDSPAAALDVWVGRILGEEGELIHVVSGASHPEALPDVFTHDVAVLILERAPENPRVATLPSAAIDPPSEARVVGFGRAADAAIGGRTRFEGHVRIAAREAFQWKLAPSPSMTCQGDSGGPLFATVDGVELLIGVNTHGDPRCEVEGFAARVDAHLAFIEELRARPLPSSSREPFDPDADACARTCATDDDCPRDTTCFASSEGAPRRCGFSGLPAGRFGAACSVQTPCVGESNCLAVPVPAGCRCYEPCGGFEEEIPDAGTPSRPAVVRAGGGGCATTPRPGRDRGGALWFAILLTGWARRRR